jgi:hypothetical protein
LGGAIQPAEVSADRAPRPFPCPPSPSRSGTGPCGAS